VEYHQLFPLEDAERHAAAVGAPSLGLPTSDRAYRELLALEPGPAGCHTTGGHSSINVYNHNRSSAIAAGRPFDPAYELLRDSCRQHARCPGSCVALLLLPDSIAQAVQCSRVSPLGRLHACACLPAPFACSSCSHEYTRPHTARCMHCQRKRAPAHA
jgi:hypothetical protein